MKIFAIRDEAALEQVDLAYLLYYEVEKRFYIELPENADPWETPLLLSSFIKKGETSINSYWSKIWVQQRIVPTDRQNLGQVLKDNNLKEYDEFDLLIGMDSANIRNMQRICGSDSEGKIHKMLEYTKRCGDVADPWYTGDFDATWNDVYEGCVGLLERL